VFIELALRFVLTALAVFFVTEKVAKALHLGPRLARVRYALMPFLPYLLGGLTGLTPAVYSETRLYLSTPYLVGLGLVAAGFCAVVYSGVSRWLETADLGTFFPGGKYAKPAPQGEERRDV
jgi:hypothetical protein